MAPPFAERSGLLRRVWRAEGRMNGRPSASRVDSPNSLSVTDFIFQAGDHHVTYGQLRRGHSMPTPTGH